MPAFKPDCFSALQNCRDEIFDEFSEVGFAQRQFIVELGQDYKCIERQSCERLAEDLPPTLLKCKQWKKEVIAVLLFNMFNHLKEKHVYTFTVYTFLYTLQQQNSSTSRYTLMNWHLRPIFNLATFGDILLSSSCFQGGADSSSFSVILSSFLCKWQLLWSCKVHAG